MAAKIVERRGAWWVVTHDAGRRTERKIGGRKEAEKVAATVNAALTAKRLGILLPTTEPEQPAKQTPTLSTFAARYLEEDTGSLAPTTLGERRRHLAAKAKDEKSAPPPILPHLGHLRLDEITPESLRTWWAAVVEGEGRKAKTGREILGSLAAVLQYARECGVLDRGHDPITPMRETLRRRARTKRGRAEADVGRDLRPIESPEAIGKLVESAAEEGPEVLAYVLLGLDAGLRAGEALAIRWSAIAWAERRLRITESRARGRGEATPPKSGRERAVALSRRLRDALVALYEERGAPAPDERVIRFDPSNFNSRTWPDVRTRAELPKVRYKDLRDTFASWLLTCGVQLGYVSVQLGHADVAVTARHYARWIGGADYRDPLVRRQGEVPADFLARLLPETASTAADGAGDSTAARDGERGVAQHPVGAEENWRAQHDSNMRPSGPQPDALSN